MFPWVDNHIMQPTFFLTLLSILSELIYSAPGDSKYEASKDFLKKRGWWGGELKENDTSTGNCGGRFRESFTFAFSIF